MPLLMSYKQKSISLEKKNLKNLVLKEISQQNTLVTEMMRSIATRSEDIFLLKTLIERKSQKLKVQSSFAEKTISEIEAKEEMRVFREESILAQVINAKIESVFYKSQFEKLIRKMVKINSQFDEDPSENEMNMSEVHVQRIMNVKIGPENTIITNNEKGMPMVTVPAGSFSVLSWKETCAQSSKIIDALLSAEILTLYPAVFFCVKRNREILISEMVKVKNAIEEGTSLGIPNFSVIITSKKSKNALQEPKKKILPITNKITLLPEPDFFSMLFKMFSEMNLEIHRSIKRFKEIYVERDSVNRNFKSKDLVEKAMRVRNYEKYSAVSPWVNDNSKYPLTTVRAIMSLQKMPQILFDLENPYFGETKTFANRIKVIHSIIVIQKFFRLLIKKKVTKSVILIQKNFRIYLEKKKVLLKKTNKFRKNFYIERLKHWFKLFKNKRREKKSKISEFDYEKFTQQIIVIQRNIRGYLARKLEIKWKKVFFKLREQKMEENYFRKKQKIWRAGLDYEEIALEYSRECEDDRNNFISKNEKKNNPKERESLTEILKAKEKDEYETRKQFFTQGKFIRIRIFE